MPVVETESLILKTYDLAEADKIVLLLTRDHGIVRGVAKGAKRLKSRFGSGLEPFTVVRATYFQKEVLELVSIQNIDLIESNFSSASDPEFLERFAYLTDILISSVPPHDPNEALFRMVRAAIQTAASDHKALESVVLYFEVWLLRLTGYLPQWKSCHICHRTFGTTEAAGLGANFELVCGNCRRLASMPQVDPEHRALLDRILRLSPADFLSLGVETFRIREVSGILKRVLSQTLGRPVAERPVLAAAENLQ